MKKRNVLITGASSGIGKSLAVYYASRGCNVILLARRKDELEKVCAECRNINGEIIACNYVCDVTDAERFKFVIDDITERLGYLDIVFANAGYILVGNFIDLKIEDYRNQFETNIFGVLSTLYLVIEHLKITHGHFVITGSINSYYSRKSASAYAMSKFALKALNDAIYHELKPLGVKTTLICLGAFQTQIYQRDRSGNLDPLKPAPPERWYLGNIKLAARSIYKAVEKGRKEVVITAHGKFLVFIQRHFPFFLNHIIEMLFKNKIYK